MGTGKTTVARYISEHYAMQTVEMDELIAQREGMSIPDIFKNHGEAYFRDKEAALLIELQNKENLIVSCGGGTPLRTQNVIEMKKNGRVILLKAKPEIIYQRVKDNHDRPLLENNKNVNFISKMMMDRKEKYEAAADLIIDTDDKKISEISKEIIKNLRIFAAPKK